MLRFQHRLSKDIDLFGYDAQWLTLLTPRLNARAEALAVSYTEQANFIKIVTSGGDIDFIIAGDVAVPVLRTGLVLEGRTVAVDPVSEILAKKLFYRAAALTVRDVYDLSAAIDLAPDEARAAVRAAAPKGDLVLRRLRELALSGTEPLARQLIPYQGRLNHSQGMVAKVMNFVAREMAVAGYPA